MWFEIIFTNKQWEHTFNIYIVYNDLDTFKSFSFLSLYLFVLRAIHKLRNCSWGGVGVGCLSKWLQYYTVQQMITAHHKLGEEGQIFCSTIILFFLGDPKFIEQFFECFYVNLQRWVTKSLRSRCPCTSASSGRTAVSVTWIRLWRISRSWWWWW